MLSADVYARYCRLRGYNVLYICGTDEYGTPIVTRALEQNCSPKQIADKYYQFLFSFIFCFFDSMVLHSSCLLLKQNFNNRLFSVFLCRYHAIHKEVYDWFDISFDKFGRTSSPEQTEICQSIFQKIFDNKWISERTMEQVFNFLFI